MFEIFIQNIVSDKYFFFHEQVKVMLVNFRNFNNMTLSEYFFCE